MALSIRLDNIIRARRGVSRVPMLHRSEVAFLGYIVSEKGITMDQAKVAAVTEWPLPDCIKALQRFLGFANFYRRFIRNFSSVAAPLTALLRGAPRKLSKEPRRRHGPHISVYGHKEIGRAHV